MEEWKECKFKDLYRIPSKNGLSKPSRVRGSGYKMINMGELFSNDRIYNIPMELVPLTDTEKENAKVEVNDLLFARQSLIVEGAGKCSIVMETDELTVFESHIIRVRLNPELAYPPFFYYYFKNKNSPIRAIIQHCVQAGIKASDLAEINVKLPPLPIQQKIAAILSSLDDKIELNNKINTNLEQQAQALFKNWFVDNDSELIENEIGKMDILITDYVANGSFKDLADNVKYLSNETDNVLIRLTDYNNNFSSDMVYISDGSYNFLEKSKLFGDEIIISNVGANVGTVFRCPRLNKKMSLAPNSIMIRGGIYEHYLYLYFTSNYGQGLLKSIVTGSAQPKFNKTNFRSLKIKIPREEKLKKFNSVYDSMHEKIINNQNENLHLASLRNTLLPKLMNGEIEV